MIKKIKGVMKLKEEIDSLKSLVLELKKSVLALETEISVAKDDILDMKSIFSNEKDEISIIVKDMRSELGNLKKEIYDFKLVKGRIQEKIISHFDSEIKSVFKDAISKIKVDADTFNRIRREIEGSSSEISKSGNELEKFNAIASKIRKNDFELVKYANKLEEWQNEKINLLKKIDSLERMVGKMRRRN